LLPLFLFCPLHCTSVSHNSQLLFHFSSTLHHSLSLSITTHNKMGISRLKKRMNRSKTRMKKSKRRFPTSTDELINEKSVLDRRRWIWIRTKKTMLFCQHRRRIFWKQPPHHSCTNTKLKPTNFRMFHFTLNSSSREKLMSSWEIVERLILLYAFFLQILLCKFVSLNL
jgi:hypothetical protein